MGVAYPSLRIRKKKPLERAKGIEPSTYSLGSSVFGLVVNSLYAKKALLLSLTFQ